MKAKEWAARISGADGIAALEEFVQEINEVAKKRGDTEAALEGAIKEQRGKWRAVLSVLPPGSFQVSFETLLDKYGGNLKALERSYRQTHHMPEPASAPQVTVPTPTTEAWTGPGRRLATDVKKYRPVAFRVGHGVVEQASEAEAEVDSDEGGV